MPTSHLKNKFIKDHYDVVLVGGGIMSTTLAMLLHTLEPTLKIAIFERLGRFAKESSSAWNNAGTGHSAFCELNYTPMDSQGRISITKAEAIATQFELSRQFWAYMVERGFVSDPEDFITPCPHQSLVFGPEDREFLRKRFEAMLESPLFKGMEYSENFDKLREWMPLIMEGRSPKEVLAATRMEIGTDVNFGALTRKMGKFLLHESEVEIFLYHEVKDLDLISGGDWELEIRDRLHNTNHSTRADFVFIGAGGYALPLLESADIVQSEGYGGFPVSGEWLVSFSPELIAKHQSKVYTLASVDAPPMSVPHLDLRTIGGEQALLFGPFAGFSTKFLKEGSYLDLPESINFKNIRSLFGAWWHNLPLTTYLVQQVAMTKLQRMNHLREFVKDAREQDWEEKVAGQRVQIIKKDPEMGGRLEFGTEVVVGASGTIATLLGASPGASVCVSAMLEVLERCFPTRMEQGWKEKLQGMMPSYGKDLSKDPVLLHQVRSHTARILKL